MVFSVVNLFLQEGVFDKYREWFRCRLLRPRFIAGRYRLRPTVECRASSYWTSSYFQQRRMQYRRLEVLLRQGNVEFTLLRNRDFKPLF
ncbi:hypothetical protein CEXT_812891 [Caerostris extrusa]|uniref:Uncharacterized protein n=1 Tax=Caerostris extrusa TaxID=172846 RepID=A0AAV4NDN2_CAEEX|nr:hypothetical protein CEXT_812891 [Caerostris extrusa]